MVQQVTDRQADAQVEAVRRGGGADEAAKAAASGGLHGVAAPASGARIAAGRAVLLAETDEAFAMRRFMLYCPGPRPKFLDRSRSPEVGLGSSRPYVVWMSPGLFGSVAIPGRALNSVVP